jgi:hypothetical protein
MEVTLDQDKQTLEMMRSDRKAHSPWDTPIPPERSAMMAASVRKTRRQRSRSAEFFTSWGLASGSTAAICRALRTSFSSVADFVARSIS